MVVNCDIPKETEHILHDQLLSMDYKFLTRDDENSTYQKLLIGRTLTAELRSFSRTITLFTNVKNYDDHENTLITMGGIPIKFSRFRNLNKDDYDFNRELCDKICKLVGCKYDFRDTRATYTGIKWYFSSVENKNLRKFLSSEGLKRQKIYDYMTSEIGEDFKDCEIRVLKYVLSPKSSSLRICVPIVRK